MHEETPDPKADNRSMKEKIVEVMFIHDRATKAIYCLENELLLSALVSQKGNVREVINRLQNVARTAFIDILDAEVEMHTDTVTT